MTSLLISAMAAGVAEALQLTLAQQELVDDCLASVAGAMLRVPSDAQAQLQELIAAFMTDPDDRELVEKVGRILRDVRQADH